MKFWKQAKEALRLAINCSAELYNDENTFEGGNSEGEFVEKEIRGGVWASGAEKTTVFEVKIEEVVARLAAGQGKEAIRHLFHQLHSPRFDVEVVRKILKSMSDFQDVWEQAAAAEP